MKAERDLEKYECIDDCSLNMQPSLKIKQGVVSAGILRKIPRICGSIEVLAKRLGNQI